MDPAIAAKLLSRLTEACADIEEVRGMLGDQSSVWFAHVMRCNMALEHLTEIQAALVRQETVAR